MEYINSKKSSNKSIGCKIFKKYKVLLFINIILKINIKNQKLKYMKIKFTFFFIKFRSFRIILVLFDVF